ncbi:MAG: hypothetical protein MJ197_01735 [Bacteroidales bacterium]|nr:hypothetical protein [Bacteroidales bacterium]
MKKQLFSLTLLILISIVANAQYWSPSVYVFGKKYPGYIIKNNGEKVEGYIEVQMQGCIDSYMKSNQTCVIFYSDPNNKKTKVVYTPDYLQGYVIADKYFKSMHYSGGLLSKPLRFLLQVAEGHISTYVWYTPSEDRLPYEKKFEEKMVYQKGNEMPVEQSMLFLNFAGKVSELVSEDVELAQKVLNKEKGYGRLNIDKIIAEYNEWYENNQK